LRKEIHRVTSKFAEDCQRVKSHSPGKAAAPKRQAKKFFTKLGYRETSQKKVDPNIFTRKPFEMGSRESTRMATTASGLSVKHVPSKSLGLPSCTGPVSITHQSNASVGFNTGFGALLGVPNSLDENADSDDDLI
jgi:hypothetical protein